MKRVLLVGVGRWGQNFLRILTDHPRAEIAGVVSSQSDFRVPVFRSLDAAFESKISWDGVILATPPEVHANQLAMCLKQGIPTFVEKPICLDLVTARGLHALAATTGTPVLVDYTLMFHPGFVAIREQLHDLENGWQIHSRGGNWGPFRSYSPLWDYGSHAVAMTHNLMGREEAGGLAGNYSVTLRFGDSSRATIEVGNRFSERIREFSVTVNSSGKQFGFKNDRSAQPLNLAIDAFLDGAIESQPWGLDLSLAVVTILDACEQSIKNGGAQIHLSTETVDSARLLAEQQNYSRPV
jgi:predicted dehydrogenase